MGKLIENYHSKAIKLYRIDYYLKTQVTPMEVLKDPALGSLLQSMTKNRILTLSVLVEAMVAVFSGNFPVTAIEPQVTHQIRS